MKTLTITGTKGKTSIVRLVSYLLSGLKYKTLSVDSERVMVNGKKVLSWEDTKSIYGLLPSQCPGKHLQLGYENNVDFCILEAVFSCAKYGLGYHHHNVGIFTNVYADHINGKDLRNRSDIAKAKSSFIGKMDGGTGIYNADDSFIKKYIQKEKIKETFLISKHAQTLTETATHYFIIEDKKINIYNRDRTIIATLDTTNISYTFNGEYFPNIINIAFAIAGLISLTDTNIVLKNIFNINTLLKQYRTSIEDGRTVHLVHKNITILLDYAHEEESLKAILKLGKKLTKKKKKLIGVIRISPERRDDEAIKIGESICKACDNYVIYDKIDGIERLSHTRQGINRYPGDMADALERGIIQGKKTVKKVIYWKDAIDYALSIAQAGDSVVIIVNDPQKTGEYIQQIVNQ